MGKYASYDGVIDFKKKKDFDGFLKLMIDNDWYDPTNDSWKNDDGNMRENADEPDEEPPVVLEGDGVFAIILPNYPIDNFHRLLNGLKKNTWEGEIRGTSDDGEFEAFIIHPDGTEEYFDLEVWAKQHNLDLEWDEEHEDWDTGDKHDVMDAFIENPKPPTNSMKFILTDETEEKKIISP